MLSFAGPSNPVEIQRLNTKSLILKHETIKKEKCLEDNENHFVCLPHLSVFVPNEKNYVTFLFNVWFVAQVKLRHIFFFSFSKL